MRAVCVCVFKVIYVAVIKVIYVTVYSFNKAGWAYWNRTSARRPHDRSRPVEEDGL